MVGASPSTSDLFCPDPARTSESTIEAWRNDHGDPLTNRSLAGVEETDHRHRRLLRAHRERPRHGATEQRDVLAPVHSITSSARASSDAGMARPSIRAIWALMTSSNFVDCTTGNSAGFAPLRIRPA